MYGMNHGWAMGLGWFLGLAVLVVLIWLIVKVISQTGNTNQAHKSALDILKERYAKGEISKEEFEEKKKDLL
jgi:putative membrane protein